MNQSLGAYAKGHAALLTLRCQPQRSPRASFHAASFPYQVTPNRRHRLAPGTNFMGAPLAFTPGYPFQKQPEKQDQLMDNVPHTHIAGVDVGGLC